LQLLVFFRSVFTERGPVFFAKFGSLYAQGIQIAPLLVDRTTATHPSFDVLSLVGHDPQESGADPNQWRLRARRLLV